MISALLCQKLSTVPFWKPITTRMSQFDLKTASQIRVSQVFPASLCPSNNFVPLTLLSDSDDQFILFILLFLFHSWRRYLAQNWVVVGSVILRDTFLAGWMHLVKLSTSFITPVSFCAVPGQLLKHLQEMLPLEWLAEVTYEEKSSF